MEASRLLRTARFGPYEADLSTGELRRDGSKIAVQEKPFQVLAVLLARPGELVGREELRSRLWPSDTFVDFETGLNTAVRKLRQALDDSAEEPRYVETLPKRGYRFLAPVAFEAQVARRRAPWRWPAAWMAAVAVAGLLSQRLGPGDLDRAPHPNRLPVIILMDSPLPGRVYDPRTLAAGGTNADDITDALRDLPVVIEKENTSPMWHREAQVLQQNPDLIVSHLSCLFDHRAAAASDPAMRQIFDLTVDRLVSFFGYVAANNPRTRFLIYSRGKFEMYGGAEKFVEDTEARFPALQGRVYTWTVPGPHDEATFRDPSSARLIRERVKAVLELR